jgi:Fibronectin type III domain
MLKTNPVPIKAKLGFNKKMPTEILLSANAVHVGINDDTEDYGKPPIEMPTFKSNIDLLSEKITAALDGGKQAIAERDQQTGVVIKMMHQLAHYVEANCKDDLPTFLKSGFQSASTARNKPKRLSQFIRQIVHGPNSGQLLITLIAVAGASSYEVRWAPVGTGGALGPWTNHGVARIRPATSITGLTPGTPYAIQVRSLSDSGYSDWTDSITRISM